MGTHLPWAQEKYQVLNIFIGKVLPHHPLYYSHRQDYETEGIGLCSDFGHQVITQVTMSILLCVENSRTASTWKPFGKLTTAYVDIRFSGITKTDTSPFRNMIWAWVSLASNWAGSGT